MRGDEAWAQGRLAGAVHMPHQEIAQRAAAELDRGVPVVVYCWSPGCNGGVKGALQFAKLGFEARGHDLEHLSLFSEGNECE